MEIKRYVSETPEKKELFDSKTHVILERACFFAALAGLVLIICTIVA
jgi:hypothetical protein